MAGFGIVLSLKIDKIELKVKSPVVPYYFNTIVLVQPIDLGIIFKVC